jgi:hypothetical protein
MASTSRELSNSPITILPMFLSRESPIRLRLFFAGFNCPIRLRLFFAGFEGFLWVWITVQEVKMLRVQVMGVTLVIPTSPHFLSQWNWNTGMMCTTPYFTFTPPNQQITSSRDICKTLNNSETPKIFLAG